MAVLTKAVLTSVAAAALALSMTACGGSTSSTMSSASSAASSAGSVASSAASSAGSAASSAVSSATEAMAAEGTLASVCSEIDAIMMGNPDADPAGTATQLEAIKAKVSTPDADLIENVAAAYTALAANPNDTAAQEKLSPAASALGAGCQSATGTPAHN